MDDKISRKKVLSEISDWSACGEDRFENSTKALMERIRDIPSAKLNGEIAFICDRLRCKNCGSYCRHTTDINHAANFIQFEGYGKWMEKEPEQIRCKECRFNYGIAAGEEFNPDDIVCTYFETDGMNENDYCSRAERKEE